MSNFLGSDLPASDWQLLGELKLALGSRADGAISAWLTELFKPLQLHPDFLNRILKSAQDATARLLQAGLPLEHIHLMIFVPQDRAAAGQSWGFFRIEKTQDPDHAVEFYLYPEG